MKVCKAIPTHQYNAVKLKYPHKNFVRAVVRFTVKQKGKYTISLDQKDLHLFNQPKFVYSPVKLTLCKLENAEFKLLSHTSSQSLRNTYLRKLIDEGEYYILVEERISEVNIQVEASITDPSQKDEIKGWRNAVLSIYGPKLCPIKIVECEEIHVIHDYLLYEGWKNYAKSRIGQKLTDFQLGFDDNHKGHMSIYLLNVPKMAIYAFKNDNEYGIDIDTEIKGITNMEIIGPEGKVGFKQHFRINSCDHDVFILRETEIKEDTTNMPVNTKFQMKSIEGTRYTGEKERSKNQSKVYDFLYFDKPTVLTCVVEKYPQLKMADLYHTTSGDPSKIHIHEEEIKVRTKSYLEPVKIEHKQGQKVFIIDDEKDIRGKCDTQPLTEIKANPNTGNNTLAYNSPDNLSKQAPVSVANTQQKFTGTTTPNTQNFDPESYSNLESRKKELTFDQVPKVLNETSRRHMNPSESNTESKRPRSILKNSKKGDINAESSNILPEEGNSIKKKKSSQINDQRLSYLLRLNKEDILLIENDELLKLIKYTGIDAFVNLYQADHSYLERLYKKLGESSQTSKKSESSQSKVNVMVKEEIITNVKTSEENFPQNVQRTLGFDQNEIYRRETAVQDQVSQEKNSRANPEAKEPEQNFTSPEYLVKQPLPNQNRQVQGFTKVTRPSIFDKKNGQINQDNKSLDAPKGKVLFEYGNPPGKPSGYAHQNDHSASGATRHLDFTHIQRDNFQSHDLDYRQFYIPTEVSYGDLINYDIPILGENFEKKQDKPLKSKLAAGEHEDENERDIIDFTEGFQNCDVVNININEPFESKVFAEAGQTHQGYYAYNDAHSHKQTPSMYSQTKNSSHAGYQRSEQNQRNYDVYQCNRTDRSETTNISSATLAQHNPYQRFSSQKKEPERALAHHDYSQYSLRSQANNPKYDQSQSVGLHSRAGETNPGFAAHYNLASEEMFRTGQKKYSQGYHHQDQQPMVQKENSQRNGFVPAHSEKLGQVVYQDSNYAPSESDRYSRQYIDNQRLTHGQVEKGSTEDHRYSQSIPRSPLAQKTHPNGGNSGLSTRQPLFQNMGMREETGHQNSYPNHRVFGIQN